MNAIVPASKNSLVLPTEGPDPFAAAAAAMGAISGHFLKFDGNSGDYSYGPADDSKELQHGDQFAINMTTFRRGWICWKDGDVADEVMVPILEGNPPTAASLKDHGPYQTYDDGSEDGWVEQNAVDLRACESGELFWFKGTSKSARRAFASLLDAFSKLYRQKPGMVPVIEISAAAFEPKVKGKDGKPGKKIGKKYAPVLTIVGWIPFAEFEALSAQGDAAATPQQEEPTDTTDAGSDNPANYETAGEENVAEAVPAQEKVVAPQEAAGRRAKRF